MPEIIVLAGASAAGKTTLGKELERRMPGVRYWASGDEKRAILREVGLPDQKLWSLNESASLLVNGFFFERLERHPNVSCNVVDTHLTYMNNEPREPGEPRDMMRIFPESFADGLLGIIFLNARTATLVSRRQKRGRGRDLIDLGMAAREQAAELEYFMELASQVPHTFISEPDWDADTVFSWAADQIASWSKIAKRINDAKN